MYKIGIIIGHNEKSKGAYSKYLNVYERDFWEKVVEEMLYKYKNVFNLSDSKMEDIKKNYVIFRVPNSGYSKEMSEVVNKLNKEKFDIGVELHFNAGGGNGTTVLYWHKSTNGKKLADLFQDVMIDNTGISRRELIQIKGADQNGAYGIMNSKCPYVLLEPFFGDSEKDCQKVSIEIMADVLFKYFNIINNVGNIEVGEKPNNNTDIKQSLININREIEDIIGKL